MGHPLRFGLRVQPSPFRARSKQPSPPGWIPVADQRSIWRIADEAGIDHLWTVDHIAIGPERIDPIFDAWTHLALIAGATSRARLGVEVTGNVWRHPALLAKIASTIDHFSGGRLEIGIGAGNAAAEFAMLGKPFPPPGELIKRLDESCSVMKALWTEDRANFAGTFFNLIEATHEPKPVQKPHPPIWIGGYGAKGTLRLVAKHAAVWNCSGGRGWDATIEANRLLDAHCERIGRDPSSVRRSVQILWDAADPDACYVLTERYIREGFSEFVADLVGDDPVATAEAFTRDGLPRLRQLG